MIVRVLAIAGTPLVGSSALVLAVGLPWPGSGRGPPGCGKNLTADIRVNGIQGAYMRHASHVSLRAGLRS